MRLNRRGAQNIRSELVSDRERQIGLSQKRVNFGIYRLVAPTSVLSLTESVSSAMDEVMPGIERTRKAKGVGVAEFAINTVMAGTFVRRSVVGKRSLELIKSGFNMARDLRALDEELLLSGDEIAVSLDPDSVHWDEGTVGARKLIVNLDKNEDGYQRLREEAAIVQQYLPDTIQVQTPNHITIGQYGKNGDGLALPRWQKAEIATAVSTSLDERGPYVVTFDEFQVGKSYAEALVEWQAAGKAVEALVAGSLLKQTTDRRLIGEIA